MSATKPITINKVEDILNAFPEVKWDRWTGELDGEYGITVFGWIDRPDSAFKCYQDFLILRIDEDGPWMFNTSSAKLSAEFSRRLFGASSDASGHQPSDASGHQPCKRVEDFFKNVKSASLSKI